jgi:hypothetical protein
LTFFKKNTNIKKNLIAQSMRKVRLNILGKVLKLSLGVGIVAGLVLDLTWGNIDCGLLGFIGFFLLTFITRFTGEVL